MGSRSYSASNPDGTYFITSTIIDWVDIFTRANHKHTIVDSLKYCIEHKGLELFAWVLMSNHIHMVARATKTPTLPEIMRDFKKFTSKKIVESIKNEPESRRLWFLKKMQYAAGKRHGVDGYTVWKAGYHAIEIADSEMFTRTIDYIHNNPVKAEIVEEPQHYIFSSAKDYNEEKGLLPIVFP